MQTIICLHLIKNKSHRTAYARTGYTLHPLKINHKDVHIPLYAAKNKSHTEMYTHIHRQTRMHNTKNTLHK